jgi:hypothetical protein
MVAVEMNSLSPSLDAACPHEESVGGSVPRLDAHHSFGTAQGNLSAGTRKALNASAGGRGPG